MSITYYGNLFKRTTSDPYNNSSGSTLFTNNNYSDIDRRTSDRGTRFVSDQGDTYPGGVILKSTPTLFDPSSGPNSDRTGVFPERPGCCPVVESEPDEDCIDDTVDFLNGLPTPSDYSDWLSDQANGCSDSRLRLCNEHRVTVFHEYVISVICLPGGGVSRKPGARGTCCATIYDWCEIYIFTSCSSAFEFYNSMESQQCSNHNTAVVGEPSIVDVNKSYCTINDEDNLCSECSLFPGRKKPIAYSRGPRRLGDDNCGQGDTQDPADEDSAWVGYSC